MKAIFINSKTIRIIDKENNLSKEELFKCKDFIREDVIFDEETEFLDSYFVETEDKILEKHIVLKDLNKIKRRIEEFKNELTLTDYIIIKSYEAKISMSDAPYSQDYLDKIIKHRQALRDKINQLENLLK